MGIRYLVWCVGIRCLVWCGVWVFGINNYYGLGIDEEISWFLEIFNKL